MQTKIFLFAALLSTIAWVTAEPAPQPASPAQTSKAIYDLRVYLSSLTAAPQWSSYSAVIQTAFNTRTFDYVNDPLSDLTTRPAFTAMPKNVQDYVISVNKATASIVSKDLSGAAPRPTGAVMAAGAAAAGLSGVVALL
ncbi:hypothetical protein MMC07_001103 [Pseudocyphellaria aurata]|nr:hypothetical protein [Pseudocyphellaria aurata]